MNIIPQKLGRQAGLEHFGLEVEDVEKVSARLREKYPSVQLIKRPTNRPFAGISTHDPEGYVFDLSQQSNDEPGGSLRRGEWKQDRYISHLSCARSIRPIWRSSTARFTSFRNVKNPPMIRVIISPTDESP